MTVGALGFVVDAIALYVFTRFVGFELLIGQAFSFSIAVVHNFLWNRHWTFPHARGKSFRRQLAQFYATNAVGIVIRTGIIALVMEPFGRMAVNPVIPSAFHKFTADYAALSTAVLIVSLWNYSISRVWTFRDHHGSR
jgi:putative flippase GtrA